MQKIILLSASALGALSVMIGAFGAHALKASLEASNRLDTFETAVKYQFYHTLALLAIGLLMYRLNDKLLDYAGLTMIGGILVFSGSLYILCLSGIRWLGAVTPIGGLLMIAGWVLLFWAIARAG
ncbi:uncharacterized membrane protein YgdD (TMEM256/DUF423 family) [Catalinimonas alkaloidigena]|uniref:DUF423 domain-containing protein n=1 Tax=Catalinimonas alkaloidigena TaxID=1075417 RepID=UPI002406B4AD|nr:DUF423 domain-containing protein [Catalinimonas alkaloidigena]MDF9794787.1 uncharacterized membrane protein YgdD (TMEM256/DUF423 family) [Catalinimonas alkaloidigena]